MRILILVNKLYGGGAERAASLWANGFIGRGHYVGVVYNGRDTNNDKYPICHSAQLYSLWNPASRVLEKLFGIHFFRNNKLKGVINFFSPDLIIGVMQPWAEIAYQIVGNTIPIINTEHNSFERPVESPMPEADRIRKYIFNKHYSHVTVLTKADLVCVNGVLDNVSVMPNPLAFTPIEAIPSKDKVILAVGRLDGWFVKGFDILITGWAVIAPLFPDWRLVIAGTGSRKSINYLKGLVSKYKIGNQVELVGYQNDILPLYQKASIFVLSSRYEGFGMVLIEAMSQGCAPIACDFKGRQREIITNDYEGLVCPTDNIEALASSIKMLISDNDRRHNIQQNAVKRSKAYCLNHIMDMWEGIISDVNSYAN